MIAARLWEIRADTAAQLSLAHQLFGDVPMIGRFENFLRQYPSGVLFSQQQLYVAQRLLVDHARDGTMGDAFTFDDGVALSMLIVHAPDIIDHAHPGLRKGAASLVEAVAFTIQAGAFDRRPQLMHELARMYEIFYRRARDDERAVQFLDLWATEDTRLSLEQQLAGGFGYRAKAMAPEGQPPRLPSSITPPILRETRLSSAEPALLEALSATRAWYQEQFGSEGEQDIVDVAWEVQPFLRRPFLTLASGEVVQCSPSAATDWIGAGVYDRLRESAKRRKSDAHDTLSMFGEIYGDLVEDYCLDLVRSVLPTDKVHGEQSYGRGGGLKTSDIAIDLGPDLILVEVRAGFLSPWFRTAGRVDEFETQLERLVYTKLDQLQRVVADLKSGLAAIEGVDTSKVVRIWPILITADLMVSDMLWQLIDDRIPAVLREAPAQRLLIGGIEDLEWMVGLVERGHDLVAVLDGRLRGGFGNLEFKRWVQEIEPEGATPSFVEANWERTVKTMEDALGFSRRP